MNKQINSSSQIEWKSKEDVLKIIKNIIFNGVRKNEIEPDEYIIVDDEGVLIGKESDFDSDVLYVATPISDIVDFEKAKTSDEFIDLSKINLDLI